MTDKDEVRGKNHSFQFQNFGKLLLFFHRKTQSDDCTCTRKSYDSQDHLIWTSIQYKTAPWRQYRCVLPADFGSLPVNNKRPSQRGVLDTNRPPRSISIMNAGHPDQTSRAALRRAIQTRSSFSIAFVNRFARFVDLMPSVLRCFLSVTVEPVLMIGAHTMLFAASLTTCFPENLLYHLCMKIIIAPL